MPGQTEQRRELVRQPWCDHLKDLFGLVQVPQVVDAQWTEAHAGRQGTCDQSLDHFRQQDLGAVTGRQQAGQPVERRGEVIPACIRSGLPGMECHAHPQGSWRVWPGLGLQGSLSRDGSHDGVGSGGKGGLDSIPHGLEQHPAMSLDDRAQQREVVLDGCRHCHAIALPQRRALFDVGEEEGDCAGRQLAHATILTFQIPSDCRTRYLPL
jgi:hypothetical protein